MNKLLNTLLSTLRSKLNRVWTWLRMWTSPQFIQTRALIKVRQFFTKLFDVRPKNKKDYYSVFRWLVSKRLAFAIVIVVGVLCTVYLFSCLPQGFFSGGSSIATYRYNAIPLKFHEGNVRILAADGHLAYQGEVSKAQCNGQGTLYGTDGKKIYEGAFAEDQYNGVGTLYYPGEIVQYTGDFVDNVFQGQGTSYRQNGTMEYSGAFQNGLWNGQGTLYNAAATPIFSGSFQNGQILFNEFLGKTTSEVSQMYTGLSTVYSTNTEYAVSMDEINAVYAAADGSDSLTGDWTVNQVYVLSDSFPTETGTITTVNDLTAYFGQPDYYGSSYVTLPEAVALNLFAEDSPESVIPVEMETSNSFSDAVTVTSYDADYEVYIYTYIKSGLLYTFYAPASGQEAFLMYSIELT